MHCVNGHHNRDDARFCRECGLRLAPEPLYPPPHPPPPPVRERESSPPPVRAPEPPPPAAAAPVATEPAPIEPVPPPPERQAVAQPDVDEHVGVPLPVANQDAPTLPPVSAMVDDGDPVPAKQPAASPPPSRPPAPKRRRVRLAAVVAPLVVVAVAGVGGFLAGRRGGGRCDAGVKWSQRSTNRLDGSLLLLGKQAAIVYGGARIGFPSPEEAAAMFARDFKEVTRDEWDSMDTVPREGLVLRERPHEGGPNRYYYSTGGAVFQVRDPRTLEKLGVDPDTAIVIPSFGLDGTRRVPPAGTLLRRVGDDQTWVIDGGSRRTADRVCDGARVVTLPRDQRVLEEIPTTPAR